MGKVKGLIDYDFVWAVFCFLKRSKTLLIDFSFEKSLKI